MKNKKKNTINKYKSWKKLFGDKNNRKVKHKEDLPLQLIQKSPK